MIVIPPRPSPEAAAHSLPLWFGSDETSDLPADLEDLSAGTHEIAVQGARILAGAVGSVEALSLVEGTPSTDTEALRPFVAKLTSLRERMATASWGHDQVDPTLRVVLMGRTQAGKSTLLEALTGGDGSRIGDGRQRFSRDVQARSCARLPGVTLIDTPGVAAKDGGKDFRLAFEQVPASDLVLWVASDDPIRESTARALRVLALMGKPLVVVINCHADLDHPARYADFLEDPASLLSNKQEHVHIIERSRVIAGAPPARWVAVHADAAFRSMTVASDRDELWMASGVERVVEVLREERDSWQSQRRMTRTADELKLPMLDALGTLASGQGVIHSSIAIQSAVLADIGTRANRVLDGESEALSANLLRVVSERRRWHTTADPKHFESEWATESERLVHDAQGILEIEDDLIASKLADTVRAVSVEWEALPESALPINDLPGFESVWINRAVRMGPAVISAAVGFFVGGPLGLAVGIGIGLVGELAAHFLKRLFKGEAQIIRERRDKVGRSLAKVLDQAEADFLKAGSDLIQRHRDGIQTQLSLRSEQLDALGHVGAGWSSSSRELEDRMRAADALLAKALLASTGRSRLASSLCDAYRLPGIAIGALLDEPGRTEGVLFPPLATAEPILVGAHGQQGSPGAALSGLMMLIADQLTISGISPAEVQVQIETVVPEGVRRTWEELLSGLSHICVRIRGGSSEAPLDEGRK